LNVLTYSERLDRVAAYIETHLDDTIDLMTLAEVAHLSSYHFHRVYHAVSGETVAVTVKRLRLQRAAGDLVQTRKSIAEIVRRSGLGSVAAFTRAFKAEYGLPPAQYRKSGSHTRFQDTLEARAKLQREVRILETAPMTGASVEHRGSYLMISRAFDKVFRWAQAHDLMNHLTAVVGVYDDDPFSVPEAELQSRACLMFDREVQLDPTVRRIEIPAGQCAVLRHRGPYADMRLAYQWLYGEWLPNSGRDVANFPVFETYLNHPRDTAPADLLVDIYMPLL
jgi:AraC family transcriptional regulator